MNAVLGDWQGPLRHAQPTPGYRPETILVPIDDRQEAAIAVPVAKQLAQLESGTIHYLYTGEHKADTRQLLEDLGLSPEDVQGCILDQVNRDPEQIVAIAEKETGPLILLCAQPAEDPEAPLGRWADAMLSTAPGYILLVPSDRPPGSYQIRRILLAHDGTPTADIAIAPTADLAHRAGAEVIALHVAARKAAQLAEPGSLPAPRYVDQPQHEWPTWASEFVQRMMALGASPAAVNFKLLVTGGQPGSEIAQYAHQNGADLVVMTWHGRWCDPEHAGTLKVVARRSACPVLLIREAHDCNE